MLPRANAVVRNLLKRERKGGKKKSFYCKAKLRSNKSREHYGMIEGLSDNALNREFNELYQYLIFSLSFAVSYNATYMTLPEILVEISVEIPYPSRQEGRVWETEFNGAGS